MEEDRGIDFLHEGLCDEQTKLCFCGGERDSLEEAALLGGEVSEDPLAD